jgi:hypothetical protein
MFQKRGSKRAVEFARDPFNVAQISVKHPAARFSEQVCCLRNNLPNACGGNSELRSHASLRPQCLIFPGEAQFQNLRVTAGQLPNERIEELQEIKGRPFNAGFGDRFESTRRRFFDQAHDLSNGFLPAVSDESQFVDGESVQITKSGHSDLPQHVFKPDGNGEVAKL